MSEIIEVVIKDTASDKLYRVQVQVASDDSILSTYNFINSRSNTHQGRGLIFEIEIINFELTTSI